MQIDQYPSTDLSLPDLCLCEVDATDATQGSGVFVGELFILPTFWHG